MGTLIDLSGEVFDSVRRFRRQLRRTAGRSFDGTGLSESQVELVRLIGRNPGISVSAAATELGLAANTASTLVTKLGGEGLILREADPADRRVGRLRLSEPAQQIADASRAARRTALAEVLGELEPDEIADLTAGLHVLRKLTRILSERPT